MNFYGIKNSNWCNGIESKWSKTKYTIAEENINEKMIELYMKIMDYKFERVHRFTPGIFGQ